MAKGTKRVIKVPRKSRAPLALVEYDFGPPPQTEDVEEKDFYQNWDHIQENKKMRRQAFCREYIKDFNGSHAIMRMGYKSKTPWVTASEWLREEYTQYYLGILMAKLDDAAIVSRQEILLGLKREAHHYGLDGSSAARISAFRAMAKILGFEITKLEGNMTMAGGVMLLPLSGSPEEWEKAAETAQEELKKKVRQ